MGQTTGQSIGMIVGGVVGGIIGGFPGAMIGMSFGGQLGLWIDPPDAPPPPPLGDLGKNSYVRSSPVPLCLGQCKVYGGVIWVGEISSGWNNEGSRKNPEWSPSMEGDFAVAHCEGEVQSFTGVYWIDDKRAGTMEEEGYNVGFTSYVGSAAQAINGTISSWQSDKSLAAINFKYTAYTVCQLKVEGMILQSLPVIAAEIKGFDTESGEEDANPIRALYNFLTDTRWGVGLDTADFNGDPDTAESPWKIEADFCDENVQIIDWDDTPVNEPRFRYSNVFDARIKAFDIITDIMMTCRGMLRVKQGKIEPLIEKATETPEVYFADQTIGQFTAGASSTVSRLYADFSSYPNIFWFGDEGDITISGTEYRFVIKDQTSTYIDLFDDLPVSPNLGDSFIIVKDNIKEGSFNFRYTADSEVANRFRIEYIVRKVKDENDNFSNEYIWDVVEKDIEESHVILSPWGDVGTNTKLRTVRLGGIKRKSQAMRMLQFFSDLALYNRNWCEFITGMQGYYHAVGDIIGVSHSQTGWNKKWFRIVGMEEMEGDEIKFTCAEYNPAVYSDTIPKVLPPGDNDPPSPYEAPDIVERFYAVQDLTENKIYILFKRPDDNPYFVGANIYVSVNGGDYVWKKTIGHVTPSVKLDAGIDDSQTVIGFDNSTLYGSFPSSGSFWIEDELISYTGISGSPDYEFTGCTRGTNATSHTSDKYCMLKESDTEYITFEDSEVGQQWTIKPVSITIYNLTADFATSPTKLVTLT
jgi:hypothetical protein